MNISVRYIILKESLCFEDISRYISFVSPKRQERIQKFKFDNDKLTSLIAGLLIREESSRILGISQKDVSLSYNEFGKPYLQNYPQYEFSVSHSKRCIVFACDSAPIGIDTEKLSNANLTIAKHCFSSGEISYILESEDENGAFYDVWTKKEAYIKMLGTGLSTPFKSFDVTGNELKETFRSRQVKDYIINVCSNSLKSTDNNVTFQELELPDVLKTFSYN